MMNKLVFSSKVILKSYVEGIRDGSSDDSFHRAQELTTQLAKNTEQREELQKLAAQGFIDKILFNTETNKLLSQAEVDDHRRTETMNRIKELQDFITGQDTAITEFDEADVRKLIQKITAYEDKFTVEFKSGISVDITE